MTIKVHERLLLTGAAGGLGQALRDRLKTNCGTLRLSDRLDWMGLIDSDAGARLDRFIGYYESYADSHATLDRDLAVQEEVRNVARAVAAAVGALR